MEKQYLLQFKNSSKHYDKFSSFDNINKAIESFCLLAFYDSNNITFEYTSTGEVFLLNNNNIAHFGYLISKEYVKHKNAYATNNGGFWNSYVYRLLL